MSAPPPITPDGRYILVRGRLWRAANPNLEEEVRRVLVNVLMSARRSVRAALAAKDPQALAAARRQVHAAKVDLGERGPVWWSDGARDFNRRAVETTPYAAWATQAAGPDAAER